VHDGNCEISILLLLTMDSCTSLQLYHAKSSSYFGETRDRISGIIRVTVQTGFLTSALAVIVVVFLLRGVFGVFTLP
jgi:hypothetical protein